MIHNASKIPRHHRRRTEPMACAERRLPIPREVFHIRAIGPKGRVEIGVGNYMLEGRRRKHSPRCSCDGYRDCRVKRIFKKTRGYDGVIERVGRVDVNMTTRQRHQRPEGGVQGGAGAVGEELGNGN